MSFQSADVFANTNPALGALVLWAFCFGYRARDSLGVEHPLVFLPLPLVLSEVYATTFQGTNSQTGLFAWMERNPELHLDLPLNIEGTRQVTRNAFLFGLRYGILELSDQGRVLPNRNFNLSAAKRRQLGEAIRHALSLADRLGKWTGDVASTRTVFYTLGIMP